MLILKKTNLAREIILRNDIVEFLDSKSPLYHLFDLEYNISQERINLYKKIYFGIGNTECYKINLKNDNSLFIKMEYTNSMGNTHYSRYWIIYLFLCEALNIIEPGKTNIIEVTSGSSGIALANAAELLNYYVTILVPSLLPESRIAPMRNRNTNIIIVPGYIKECVGKLQTMVKTGNYFATNHSEEKSNTIIKVFSRIGYEIVQENIKPDYAILAIGNGTSTSSIAEILKEKYSNIKTIGYQPMLDNYPKDIVFGLIVPDLNFRHLKPSLEVIDKIKYTNNIDLKYIQNKFKYDTEISNFGFTSLYGVYFATELAKVVSGKNILSIGYDKIDRY